MKDEKQIKSVYRRLTILRDRYEDDIPSEEVTSASKNNRYKCRLAWWGFIRDEFHVLEEINILPPEIIKDYQELWVRYIAKINQDRFGVKPEDIQAANDLVSRVLEVIKGK